MIWTEYWFWLAAALIMGILEILAPGYILLGFAISAGIMGGFLYTDGALAGYLAGSFPISLVVFAVLALIIWLILRKVFGIRKGQVKIWETDINDN